MTNDEIAGRLHVLEVATMLALGMYIANSRNDPTYEKAGSFIDTFAAMAKTGLNELTPEVRDIGVAYADRLASILRENVRALRGEGGQSH